MTADPIAIRARAAAVIRALLAKTTAAGATEAEALAAAAKAREFMDKFHIEQGDLGMKEEGTAKADRRDTKYRSMNLSDRISLAVAKYCDCRAWGVTGRTTFFGLKSDAEFASWLQDSLEAFVRTAAKEFMARWQPIGFNPKARWQAEKAFVVGACARIAQRLSAETKARKDAMAAAQASGKTGTSLVVVKDAIVQAGFQALGLKLSNGRSHRTTVGDRGAYDAGRSAGDRASFGRPLGGSSLRRIG
jgi:hypothetical protein